MAPPIKPSPSGFREMSASTTAKPRLIISIMGEQKSGKNHFAFGMPGYKAYHSFDFGDEGVVEKFLRKGHKIKKAEYRLEVKEGDSPQAVCDKATPLWQSFKANFAIGLTTTRTSIIDTGGDCYELVRMSHFGKLQQVLAHHYAPVNAEMKDLFRAAYSTEGHNLVILNRMKDEYVNKMGPNGKEISLKTGQRVFAGYSQTPFEVQVHLRAFRETDGFKMEILDCRQNPDVNGMVLEGDMVNFATLGQLVYPDSEEGDWV